MTALAYTVITGTFEDGQGNPLSGVANFTPNVTVFASGIPVLTAGVPITAQITSGQLLAASGGAFQLLASDNSGLGFEGLTGFLIYEVQVTVGGQELDPWSFSLPSSPSTVELYALANTGSGGGGGGSGTVTSVSVVTANGLAGTVANPSTTPAITLRTSVTGLLKGNGTTISAAAAGTDYLAPAGNGSQLTGITASQAGALPAADDLSAIATANPTAGSVAMNGHKVTGLSNGTVSTDAAAFGQLSGLAPLASPAFTGTPTAPTATPLANSTQLATTAYADAAVAVEASRATTAEALLAPKASPTFTGTVTVPATVNATDAAQKAYVDSVAQGLDNKPSVTALAAANISLTGTQTIDGVGVVAGNRVLATGQSTASQNGIWTVASGAWTRPADFASGSVQLGASVFVEGGTSNSSSGWTLTGTSPVTVDSGSQTWTQFSGAGEITAGTGLSKSGNTLSNTGVLSVSAADTSVVVGGTGAAPTVRTNTLDVIAAQHAPAADWSNNSHKITSLANGSGAQDAAAYGQTPAGGNTATIAQGGTGQATQQAAIDALAGAVTSAQFLRGNGTHVQMSAIQAADVPTLNQSTTGTAANLTGAATFPAAVSPHVATLSDGSSVALDASLGNVFRWSLGGASHTLAAPSNAVDGKMIRVRIIYGGSFTPLFNATYAFGTDGQPSWSAASGKIDLVAFEYDADANGGGGAWTCAGWKLGYT
jgi:hypothetical protein